MDSATDVETAREWWVNLAPQVPRPVRGLWFGITDLVRDGEMRTELYVSMASTYDPDDLTMDWACDPDWLVEAGYVFLPELAALSGDHPAQLAHAVAVVTALHPQELGGAGQVTGAVAVGFDDGDAELVWSAPPVVTRRPATAWFALRTGQGKGLGCVKVYEPDSDGLDELLREADQLTQMVEAWPDGLVWELADGTIADGLAPFVRNRLFSAKARSIIDGLRGPDDLVQWLPVTIRAEDGSEHDYHYLHLPESPDVLDHERSSYISGDFLQAVVLDKVKVADRHVFRLPGSRRELIVSSVLKKALLDGACTGLSFARTQAT